MDRAATRYALKGGVAGTAVLSVLLLGIEVQTRSRVRVAEVLIAYVGTPGQQSVAVFVFLFVTAVLWPLAFVALDDRDLLPGRTRTRRAVLFALALAIAFAITGRGDLSGPVLVLYGVGVLGAYVAYGLTLARILRPTGKSE